MKHKNFCTQNIHSNVGEILVGEPTFPSVLPWHRMQWHSGDCRHGSLRYSVTDLFFEKVCSYGRGGSCSKFLCRQHMWVSGSPSQSSLEDWRHSIMMVTDLPSVVTLKKTLRRKLRIYCYQMESYQIWAIFSVLFESITIYFVP